MRLSLVFVAASACAAPDNYLLEKEEALGTDSDLNRSFHVVADEPQGFGLRMEGVIIGIEKSDRRRLEVPRLTDDPNLNAIPRGFSQDNQERLVERLDDRKRTFISHIVEARLDTQRPIAYLRNQFLYDAYYDGRVDDRRPSSPRWDVVGDSWYERSWESLGMLESHIAGLLRGAVADGAPYTHVVVATMGWNTHQEKAIRNINSIFGNILEAADGGFKPLFIAITWPSEWNTPGVSLKNKAGDADEIGFVWANALLNRHLPGLRSQSSGGTWPEFQIVAIGHSLGARLVTRAAFSGAALNPPVALQDGVDLVIGLQGAFSMNRFLAERRQGREGAPYAAYADLRGAVVLTWSEWDSATPLANLISGANYAGAKSGYERARDKDYERHFSFFAATENGGLSPELTLGGASKTVNLIDASRLVRYSVLGAGGGAHSDIYNAYMGRLLFDIIDAAAR